MFTVNIGRTKEVFALALVASTSVSQVSHMLVEILQKRSKFSPSLLYHDTCPHNQDFWRLLFGANVNVRLGLFHLLHQIVDTLDSKCELYWKGLVSLKEQSTDMTARIWRVYLPLFVTEASAAMVQR
jgi:hypothetical protein